VTGQINEFQAKDGKSLGAQEYKFLDKAPLWAWLFAAPFALPYHSLLIEEHFVLAFWAAFQGVGLALHS